MDTPLTGNLAVSGCGLGLDMREGAPLNAPSHGKGAWSLRQPMGYPRTDSVLTAPTEESKHWGLGISIKMWPMDLSDAFHRAADQTDDANDHDELHAAGMVLHLDLIADDLHDGDLLNQEYLRRWILNLRERHGIDPE